MSWTTHIGPTSAGEIEASLKVAPLPDGLSAEALEQIELAKMLALAIVQDGCVGDEDQHFYVSLSGHANPEHQPTEGWANDCVSVSVSQATVATEPAVAEDTSEQDPKPADE